MTADQQAVPPPAPTSSDRLRQLGLMRIETVYLHPEKGSLHTRTDLIKVADFPRLTDLLNELRI